MKYSVQNPFGEVYGIFDVPETNPPLTPEEFAAKLKNRLIDNPVIEDVRSKLLGTTDSKGERVLEDRIIVALDTFKGRDEYDLSEVHTAVGMVSLMHELGEE